MSFDVNVWSNVQVAIQTALGAAKTISDISKASPAVADSTAHGFTTGDIVLLKIKGMRELNWRVVRVGTVTTDDFELEGIDSTDFRDFVSGTAEEVTFGAEAATFQDFSPSGGEAAGIGINTIHDDQDFEIPGNRTPLIMQSNSLWVPDDPALVAMKGFDMTKTPGCALLEFATGARVLMAAYMSANLAPGGAAGAPVTTSVSLRVRGQLTMYAD